MAVDPKLAGEIAYYLNGSCQSEDDAAETFNVTTDEVLEAATIGEIERCGLCGWWDESSNFNSNGNCLDCEPDDGEG
jgi:hypothetical protein